MWARNPIPRIFDSKTGLHDPQSCPGPSAVANPKPGCLAFPAPCPWDTYATKGFFAPCKPPRDGHPLHKCDGDGMGQCSSDWVVGVVSDHVLIPQSLAPGEYGAWHSVLLPRTDHCRAPSACPGSPVLPQNLAWAPRCPRDAR